MVMQYLMVETEVPLCENAAKVLTFLITSCILNIFRVTQFFPEQQYFLRKVQKTVAAAHLTIFLGKETFV